MRARGMQEPFELSKAKRYPTVVEPWDIGGWKDARTVLSFQMQAVRIEKGVC